MRIGRIDTTNIERFLKKYGFKYGEEQAGAIEQEQAATDGQKYESTKNNIDTERKV